MAKTTSVLPHIGPAKKTSKAPAVDAPMPLVETLAGIVKAELTDRDKTDTRFFGRVTKAAESIAKNPSEVTAKRLAEQVRTACGAVKGSATYAAIANLFTAVNTLRKYTSAPYGLAVSDLTGMGRWKFSRISRIGKESGEDMARFGRLFEHFKGLADADARKWIDGKKNPGDLDLTARETPAPSFEKCVETLQVSLSGVMTVLAQYSNPSVDDKEAWMKSKPFTDALDKIHDTLANSLKTLPEWYVEFRTARETARPNVQEVDPANIGQPSADAIAELEPTSVA